MSASSWQPASNPTMLSLTSVSGRRTKAAWDLSTVRNMSWSSSTAMANLRIAINVQLGRFSRNRTNVWNYPGVNTLSRQGDEGNLLELHLTVKPVALIADALLDC